MVFKCDVCKLEYSNNQLAEACQDWCSTHQSCNFQIAKQAINKDAAKNMPIADDERFKTGQA